MSKVLEVTLPGPEGMTWTETYDAIATARTKHYATINEFKEGSAEWKRLMEISLRDLEILDWSRRVLAPDKIRGSWHHCRLTVKNEDGEVVTGIVTNKMAPDPRLATLEAENAKLKAELAKAGKVAEDPSEMPARTRGK